MKRLMALLCLIPTLAYGGGKDLLPAITLVPATSMTGNIASPSLDVRGWDNVDLELIASGSPTGTFQVDCAIVGAAPAVPTWVTLSLSPAPAVTGSASNILIELNQTGCQYIRVRYTFSSGTGSLTVMASAKQI